MRRFYVINSMLNTLSSTKLVRIVTLLVGLSIATVAFADLEPNIASVATSNLKPNWEACSADTECASGWCGCNWSSLKVCLPSVAYPKQCKSDNFDWPLGQSVGDEVAPGHRVEIMQNYRNRGGGEWYDNRYHAGVDLIYRGIQNQGQPVYAAADGTVACVANIWYPGSVVVIEHTLLDGSRRYTQYGHLEHSSLMEGQVVFRGEQIGTLQYQELDGLDNTHLHFEYRDWLIDEQSEECAGPGYAYENVGDGTPESQGWHDPVNRIFQFRPQFPVWAFVDLALNVRPSPSTSLAPIGQIQASSWVKTYAKVPDETGAKNWWYRIGYLNQSGYVQTAYIAGFYWDGWWGDVFVAEERQASNADGYLRQSFWRSNQGFARSVPTVGSTIRWDGASPWSSPVDSSTLPGSGNVQSKDAVVAGQTFIDALWRGNQGWTRTIPISSTGTLLWNMASVWQGPLSLSGLPGFGGMQSQDGFYVADTYWQAFWRGNQGWYRTVPVVNGELDWNNASPWGGPLFLSNPGLPGQGSIQAQSTIVVNETVAQGIWRGGQGWSRTVPIYNGRIYWHLASDWGGPMTLDVLPGSGEIQGTDAARIKTGH